MLDTASTSGLEYRTIGRVYVKPRVQCAGGQGEAEQNDAGNSGKSEGHTPETHPDCEKAEAEMASRNV